MSRPVHVFTYLLFFELRRFRGFYLAVTGREMVRGGELSTPRTCAVCGIGEDLLSSTAYSFPDTASTTLQQMMRQLQPCPQVQQGCCNARFCYNCDIQDKDLDHKSLCAGKFAARLYSAVEEAKMNQSQESEDEEKNTSNLIRQNKFNVAPGFPLLRQALVDSISKEEVKHKTAQEGDKKKEAKKIATEKRKKEQEAKEAELALMNPQQKLEHEYNGTNMNILKNLLRGKGLRVSGNKSVLIDRLMEYQKKYDAGDLEVDSENELEQEGGCDASIRDDGEQREETSKASSTTTSDRVPRPSRRRRPNKKYTSSLLCGEEEEVEEVEEVTSEVEELEEELRCVHLYHISQVPVIQSIHAIIISFVQDCWQSSVGKRRKRQRSRSCLRVRPYSPRRDHGCNEGPR